MGTSKKISQQELLARKFEEWQKDYYDNVYSFFQKKDPQRLVLALETWERRFVKFLRDTMPEMADIYDTKTSRFISLQYYGDPIQNFKQIKSDPIEAFLAQCIEDARKGKLDNYYLAPKEESMRQPKRSVPQRKKAIHRLPVSESSPRVFISHSSLDGKLAKLILELISIALNLEPKDIRCTSVKGYGLPGGADIDEQLRKEIRYAKTLIGLISKKSFGSPYVLFELGARWETGHTLIPLLYDMRAKDLKGPIKRFNALNCNSSDDLRTLVSNVALQLDIQPKDPSTYQNKIEEIVRSIAKAKRKTLRSPKNSR